MRRLGLWVTVAVSAAASLAAASGGFAGASAQSLEGPLATPDWPVKTAPKHPPPKRAKIKAAERRGDVPVSARLPSTPVSETPPQAAAPASKVPTDPISFGMKWNGTNESGRETRIDNLNGDATGVGGAVGLKLHF